MLSYKDCLDYIGLTEEEVQEVAHHEQIPIICALEECGFLLQTPIGLYYIKNILIDNIEEARRNQNKERECCCMEIFINFLEKHKELE